MLTKTNSPRISDQIDPVDWVYGDRLGDGSRSIVYKAYHLGTGEIVAAKVPKNSARETREKNLSIVDRNWSVLENIQHENIIRLIGVEKVIDPDDSLAERSGRVFLFEYCNGGSLAEMLRLPIHRFGLPEDLILILLKDLTNALKYLHSRNFTRYELTTEKILQTIDDHGRKIFKLTDTIIPRGDQTNVQLLSPKKPRRTIVSKSTPANSKSIVLKNSLPSDGVDLWPLGLIIYECSTGQFPFRMADGKRADQSILPEILREKPFDCISGVQRNSPEQFDWSKTFPETCRLSSTLKEFFENLLIDLFSRKSSNRMSCEDFFDEMDYFLHLVPLYYVNMRNYTLSCVYFPPLDSIDQLIFHLRRENGDDDQFEYQCLFQNEFYPLVSSMTIVEFLSQFSMGTSRQRAILLYPISPFEIDFKNLSKFSIPSIEFSLDRLHPNRSVFQWSEELISIFLFVKEQLKDYQRIEQTIYSSLMTMNRIVQSKILQLLSSIRENLLVFQLDQLTTLRSQSSTVRKKSIIQKSPTEPIFDRLQHPAEFSRQLIDLDRLLTRLFEEKSFHRRNDQFTSIIEQIDFYIKETIDLNELFERNSTIDCLNARQYSIHKVRERDLKEISQRFFHFLNGKCSTYLFDVFSRSNFSVKCQSMNYRQLEEIRLFYEDLTLTIPSIDEFRVKISPSTSNFNEKNLNEILPNLVERAEKNSTQLTLIVEQLRRRKKTC